MSFHPFDLYEVMQWQVLFWSSVQNLEKYIGRKLIQYSVKFVLVCNHLRMRIAVLLLPQNESFLSKEGTGSLLLVDCVALPCFSSTQEQANQTKEALLHFQWWASIHCGV